MLEVLEFVIEGRRWALLAGDVVEVLRAVAIAELPRAPAVVEGVIDVRGTLVPVYDLRRRFGLPERRVRPSDQLIVARAGERRVALRCDRAARLHAVDPAHMVMPAEVAPWMEAASGTVTGMARLPDGLLVVHDLRAFLSEAEAADLDAAMRAAGTPGSDGAGAP